MGNVGRPIDVFPGSVEKPVGSRCKALYAQRPVRRLLSALRNGSICDCATVFDAAPLARGRRVAIDGSCGLPSNKADGQVTQTARDEAAGAVRVAGRRGARADERRAERAAERRADAAADRRCPQLPTATPSSAPTMTPQPTPMPVPVPTHVPTTVPTTVPSSAPSSTPTAAPSASPTITKAPTPDDDDETAWCDFLGKELRPAADEPVVVLRRARGPRALSGRVRPGLRRVVRAAAAARLQNRGRRAARPLKRVGRRRRPEPAPGRGVPVGVMSSFVVSCCPPSVRSLIRRRDQPSGCEALASQASCCSRATREQCSIVLRASCILK